jgi:hypothetical protein
VPLDLLDMTGALGELLDVIGCPVEVVVRDEAGDEIVMVGPARLERCCDLWPTRRRSSWRSGAWA